MILYPGLNDIRRVASQNAKNYTDFKYIPQLLNQLVALLKPIAPLIIMTAVPHDESKTLPFRDKYYFTREDALKMYNIVVNLAGNNGLAVFDTELYWSQIQNLSEYLADGLHCNTKGHEKLFQDLRFFLEKLYA